MFIQTLNKLLCVYFWTWWHSKACWTNCTGSCVRGSYVAFQHANFSAWNVLFFPVIHQSVGHTHIVVLGTGYDPFFTPDNIIIYHLWPW